MTVALRDKRKPGHCWQDNELYDVFQPVIGATAAHVFAAMTRWAFGHRVQMGVREIAAESGVGRSTVARALIAMERLGMLRRVVGRGTEATACDLLDLKEAAQQLGAEWNPQRASWALSPERVLALRRELASVPQRDATPDENESACVPPWDAALCGKPSASVPQRDAPGTPASQKTGSSVPPADTASIYRQDTRLQDHHPLPPPPAEGERRAKADEEGELRPHVDAVLHGCWIDRERKGIRRAVAGQLRALAEQGELPAAAAARMVAVWRAYREAKPFLRYEWGPAKFFAEGHWRDVDGWPYDERKIERRRLEDMARVGMAR